MATSEDREKERTSLRAEEEKELELRSKGILILEPTPEELQLQKRLVRLALIAKTVSKTEIAYKAFRNGKLEILTEPIGNEDLILQQLIAGQSGRREER